MSEFFNALLVGGLLAGVGYAAWVLSRDAVSTAPKPETPYQQGLSALLAGNRSEALRAFAETVRIDTDNIDAYIHLGNLLREEGEPERALKLHGSHRGPDASAGARREADLDLLAGEEGGGREARRCAGGTGRTWGRALLAQEAVQGTRSRREAGRARRGQADTGHRYRSALGEIYLRDGRIGEAKRQFQSTSSFSTTSRPCLGDIYYEGNRPDRASVLWKALAEAHPPFSHLVLERLETSYFEKGRFHELDQTYEEMLARNPRDVRIVLAMARMHLKKGDLADAGRMLNEALELDPQSVPARLLLADLYRRRGDLTRALEELESILREVGSGEAYICASCGAERDYWSRCPRCLAWAGRS
jgi:lipopolysaccharide biosynthesis regulator YciM